MPKKSSGPPSALARFANTPPKKVVARFANTPPKKVVAKKAAGQKRARRDAESESDSECENHEQHDSKDNHSDSNSEPEPDANRDPDNRCKSASQKAHNSGSKQRRTNTDDETEEADSKDRHEVPTLKAPSKGRHQIKDIQQALKDLGVRKKNTRHSILGQFKIGGRLLPRAVSPFHSLIRAFQVGLRVGADGDLETDHSIEELDEEERLELEYVKDGALVVIPSLSEHVKALVDIEDVEGLHYLLDYIDAQGRHACTNDIGNLRYNAMDYIPEIPGIPRISQINRNKSDRGFVGLSSGQMLCPRNLRDEFDKDPEKFCREDGHDPNAMDIGLLRGPFLVACFCHIFTGPRTAMKSTPGPSAGKKPIAELYKMTEVTVRTIAYIAVLARFVLNGQEEWSIQDGDFDSITFFHNIIQLFDEDEGDPKWTKETLTWWNSCVFGAKSRNGAARAATRNRPQSGNALLAAQRAARRNQN